MVNPNNWQPEAKNYSSEEWAALTAAQKTQVQQLKASNGWINGYTPPHGFVIGADGYPTPSQSMVSAMQSIIANTNTDASDIMVPLPPPPSDVPAPGIPPVIDTNPAQAGNSFGRSGSRRPTAQGASDNSTMASVSRLSVNGRNYFSCPIFVATGRRLN